MSRLEELPPDQRAALSLLVRQRKSYAEVADMLNIPARAVHDRAHAALAVLAPRQARSVPADRRLEVGDYLLGQQTGISERLKTRTYLNSSDTARDWAQAVAAELAPLNNGQLPEIPAGGGGAAAARPAGPATGNGERAASPQRTLSPPSSRLGGALILAAIVVAIVVAVVLLTTGGGKSAKSTAKKSTTTTTAATGPAVRQIVMHPPDPSSKTVGVVEILSEAGKRAFYIEADNLPSSTHFFYAVWLYNSPTNAEPLSKAPPVGATHRLAGGALLPANAGKYKEILLTRETKKHPTHPGHTVLAGAFSL